ncbi:endolytic transglycosylase MltG [Hymenobacter sp. BRD67]|uniref:endolytic transglycosylase MltG n=1 Tax=Hymenobacter sp. BRD67 TaxID=2675877 RepID=UPI001563FC83|nr:endolytic transglycosylase MltG [Hymenobacter sp. BRD67]QKG53600.1 endolytic transglycosylase MltG [Hymenobacter sp. BRD67]
MTEPVVPVLVADSARPTRQSRRGWLVVLVLTLAALVAGLTYQLLYRSNVPTAVEGPAYLYIRRGAGLKAVLDSLTRPGLLARPSDFARVARWRGYGTPARPVRPGRYTLPAGTGNLDLLRLLESGRQDTVVFTIQPFHYLPQLPRQAGRQLDTDTARLHKLLADNAYLVGRYGLDTATVRTLFIPGQLRLCWPTPAAAFLDSVAARHRRFWNAKRLAEADSLKMTPVQVAVLASIVQRETAQPTDKPIIAGVYLNRLRRGQPLQADPTLLWPLHGLGTRKRVLNVDKNVDSPYNTYRHKGLPPGPITTPYPQALEAVLRPAHHHYVFFCARPDGSGFSDFAATFAQHKQNARRYQHHLDSLKIKR